MPPLLEQFSKAMPGLAALNAYPHTTRQAHWLQRLAINAPDIQALLAAPAHASVAYAQPPGVATAPGGIPARHHTQGMAVLARHHQQCPDCIPATVQKAQQAAQQNHPLHAFIHLASDAALAAQIAALPQGQTAQDAPLLGVPIAVKDLMRVQGFPMTGGSGGTGQPHETQDALAVARLRQAGAVVLGTTNLHELAYGITSENPHHGKVGNPHHGDRTAGGSSGGSAAAVAAGVVRMAVGTDTSGSVRIPAACCGVVGFKPSFDAIPRDGVMTLGNSLDHVGALAVDVHDAALAFSLMAGLPASVAAPPPDLRGVRIGVPRAWFFDPLAPQVAASVEAALMRMRQDGAELVCIDIAGIAQSAAVQFATLCSEASHAHWQRLIHQPDTLGEDVRVRLEIGQFLPARWYVHAQHVRADLAHAFAQAMQGVDVLVTPTLRIPPPVSGQTHVSLGGGDTPIHPAIVGLTQPFNQAGLPAISLPCQRPGELPVGIQLSGRIGDDWTVLNLAARLEQLLA